MDPDKDKKIEDILAGFEAVEPGQTAEAEAEKAVSPETPLEQKTESVIEKAPVQAEPILKAAKVSPTMDPRAVQSPPKGVYYPQVEGILEDGLEGVFRKMTPEKQEEFKKAGEEAVIKISRLLSSAKVRVRKILSLIINWLKIIPGVNKFFLEQEAKIKTDRILQLKNRK